MFLARRDGVISEPEPAGRAVCPSCGATVLAKCGEINAWHWAHESLAECDPWAEGESEWHLGWKRRVRHDCCEVVKGRHRADIVGNGGLVVELQHSAIDPATIREREIFYGRMVWVFDAEQFASNIEFRATTKGYETFRWRHARKSQAECKSPMFWDFGPDWEGWIDNDQRLFQVKKLGDESPVGGWGVWVSESAFLLKYLSNVLR